MAAQVHSHSRRFSACEDCSSLIHSGHIEALKHSASIQKVLSSPCLACSPAITAMKSPAFKNVMMKDMALSPVVSGQRMRVLRSLWTKNHQEQVFGWVDKLDNASMQTFLDSLEDINVAEVNKVYQVTAAQEEAAKNAVLNVAPFTNVTRMSEATTEQRAKWEQDGLSLIAEGKVGVLLLAGGQASRLGCLCPKGTYDIGFPSKKSLYQMQVERAIKVQRIAAQRKGIDDCRITWYIMTSPATYLDTVAFFMQHNFFGQPEENFFIFNQGTLPCLTPEGRIINEAGGKIALAPNGNGGLYAALKESGALKDMAKRGVKYIAQFCVDNVLIRVADPVFLGFMADTGADCAAKVVPKAYPEEPVGVMCLLNGKPSVIEYSEITPALRNLKGDDGELVYNYSHICINNFTVELLQRIADEHLDALPYHVARKKIPNADANGATQASKVENGWKLERFIFDAFQFSNKMVAFEARRDEEFSPLKNASGMAVPKDSPETCLLDVSRLCAKYITDAGGVVKVVGPEAIEISPLVSYAGEDLEDLVKGKTFETPVYLA